jgi:multidrug efflux pump subunit AcrA (membrane-fusion protein)
MNRKNFYYLMASILVIGIALALSGFFMKNQPEPKRNMEDENLLYVQVDTVSTRKLHPSMTYEGRINSYETVSLAAEVRGRIMEGNVPFKEGEDFNKGELLVQIYKEDAQAAMTSGKSNFLRTLSSILPDLKVDFPDEYQKWKKFFNEINVKGDLPRLPEINSEQEQVFLASRGVLSEYYSLRQQEINLKKYNLYAPFDGAFQKVNQQVGAIASPGAALASIVRTDRLEAVVPVPPEDARWVQPEDEVKLTGNNGIVRHGRVTRVADFLDPSTQSVNVYIKYLPTGSQSFKVGEFVQATFDISKEVSGFTIPREALLDEEEVYVVRDSRLRKEPVKVVRTLQDHVVLSGLESGTLVVSESLVDVSEGQEVNTR